MPVVPGYSVFGRCWEDAISITFAGHDSSSGRAVYLRMNKLRRPDAGRRSPLRRDFEICAKAQCNAILKPLDFVKLDEAEYLVSPDDGTLPLAEILLQKQPSFAESLELLIRIADALAEAHQECIVHCNLSPGTIWTDNDLRQVRLTDFSRATFASEISPEHHPHIDFHYLAPEQTGRTARAVDARSDLYSVGAVGYHLLCGRPPFDDIEPLALIHAHLARVPTSIHVVNPEIPQAVSSILAKLLSKAPEERYQTAIGLKSDLQQCLKQWRAHGSIVDIKIGLTDASAIFKISNKLYGRDSERAVLQAAFDRARDGGAELVLISGPPGIGKSFLAQSLQSAARSSGAFVSGKSDQYKQNEPYSVIAQAFGILIEQLLCNNPERIRIWRERVIEVVGPNANLIVDVIPALADLIGRGEALPELPTTEKRHRFNYAFRQFVKVFSNRDHPLCIFLDDLQWADPASLALIQSLLTDREISHLLVVGALRPSEDIGDDGVGRRLDEIARSGVRITRISLSQLDIVHICELLRDTLDCSEQEAASFAALVKTKTDGNPFFISQFLSFLNHQRLVVFDFAQGRWVWDLRRISEEGITDNVLVLMKRKLADVPDMVQSALGVASCVGNRFAASTLSLVMREPTLSIVEVLRIAEREGLIISIGESEAKDEFEFKFLHDRVQQAAHALIPEASRPALRLQIGRRLLAALPAAERDAASFVILDNLNSAMQLITDRPETESLARLNAHAGRRAREIAAFDAALGYFRNGIKLIQPDGWRRHRELTLDLHLGCFECAYVVGQVEEANALFVAILDNSAAPIDKAKAYYLKILLNTGMDKSEEAVAIGREALRLFNEYLPENPTQVQLFRELAAVILRLRGRRASELVDLPKMTDPSTEVVVTLLMSICPAAYFRNPDLMVFAALRIMNLSLRHGNSRASSFGYVLYGLARGALFGDYKGGHEFGRLAVQLATSDADPSQQCKIITIFSGWLNFWREPVDDSVRLLRSSLKLALEAGDIQYAHYAVLQTIFLRFARGANLDELRNEIDQYQPVIERAADWFTQTTFGFRRQFILALQDRKGGLTDLSDIGFDRDSTASVLRAAGNLTALTYYFVAKAQLAYLFGSFSEARRYSDAADAGIKTIVNQIIVVEHYFYRGLISAALMRQDGTDRAALWTALRRCSAKLARYAKNCPENFASHHHLLQAETASVGGRNERAAVLFDEAAALARQQTFHQIEALANELAGERYLASNRERVASTYLLAARKCYVQWGAFAKANQLSQKYGVVFQVPNLDVPSDVSAGRRSETRTDIIDVDTVMRATMALSGDLESDRLLGKLMRLILECMGGERAFMLSKRAGALQVEAMGLTDGTQVRLDLGPDARNGLRFSESVVNYVLHTGREIVLEDAKADARFQTCPYVAGGNPRSIACVPITKMGATDRVAYVESSRSGAFSDERVRGLILLSQQVFAAIENMQLQTRLNENSETLKSALQSVELLSGIRSHLAKFVPRSVQRLIENNPLDPDLATHEQDITVMFLDVAGSTSMSEQLGSEELKRIIETYFSGFVDDIFRNGGEINEVAGDGLMIVFQHPDPNEHARLATRSAISIREKTSALNANSGGEWPRVVINIGIHSGTALVGANKIESAAETLWVYTATGYSVNVAARIGSAASNGAILVSEATASRLGSEFHLVARGGQAFKGVSELIGVYSVEDKAVG
ncbi:AAA family ATPase [Bradyrhizobium lablabi]|uniref:AAA family ATPase n=1 Tax=Bradyrhizobium lablabi TaxID=722472 RepID=UPI001BA675DA|nr:AAA family ATPase [Bradyrhizobium lablabi]